MNTTHSKIGASSCGRWWNCPGSVALVATLPEEPPSPYAAEGTAAHELAERSLRENKIPYALVGQVALNGIEFDVDMAEAVQTYIDVIKSDMVKTPGSTLQIEHKFHLLEIDSNAFGTNDANLREFMGTLRVYDFKYGAGVAVDAEDNKQGLYYALGAALEGDFEKVEIIIVQPRAQHRKGPVRRWMISIEDLQEFALELQLRIEETRDPKAPLNAGPWCHKHFCPALATCPAVRKEVELASENVFDEVREVVLPTPDQLTSLGLRRLLDAIPLIDAWIKAVEGHALAMAMRGEKVIDYKLVRKKTNRKWRPDAEALLSKSFTREEIYNEKLKPITELEKSLGKDVVSPLIEKPTGSLILVHEDDPRESVKPETADQVFNESNLIN